MTDQTDGEPKPKIIVDEGWKAQVEEEKEALRHKQEAEQPEKAADAGGRRQPGRLPPASLTFLATTLATQATVALGLVPDPLREGKGEGKNECRLEEARHFIDTLEILQEKTEGNRTPEETEVLESLLHELRMGFVSVQSRQSRQTTAGEA